MDRNGAMITAAFALAWALSATTAIPSGPAATGARVVAVTVTALAMIAAVVFAAERRPGHATASGLPVDWQRRFNVIGAVQCASIALLVLIASTTGLLRLVPASVCLVVGLHFFPLAKVLGMRYRPVGLLLCVVGAVGVVLSSTHGLGASVLLVGTGAALILWGASFRHTSTGLRVEADPRNDARSAPEGVRAARSSARGPTRRAHTR